MRHLALVLSLSVGLSASAQADFKPSPRQQVELGKRAATDLRKQERILPKTDIRVTTLKRVARRLLDTFSDGDKPWEYSFDVVESKEVNAFALPGGPVFFYTGLLEKMKSEDELAAVLAHELTHVRKEHWAYAYRDSMNRSLVLNIILMVGKANDNTANLAGIANELIFDLPFSRKHELEADNLGFDMMTAAGYNPNGMVKVFQTLKAEAKGGGPEWASTHPDDGRRIKNIEARVAKGGKYPALIPMELPKADPKTKKGD
jgi:predicted Zn-dependent protease